MALHLLVGILRATAIESAIVSAGLTITTRGNATLWTGALIVLSQRVLYIQLTYTGTSRAPQPLILKPPRSSTPNLLCQQKGGPQGQPHASVAFSFCAPPGASRQRCHKEWEALRTKTPKKGPQNVPTGGGKTQACILGPKKPRSPELKKQQKTYEL